MSYNFVKIEVKFQICNFLLLITIHSVMKIVKNIMTIVLMLYRKSNIIKKVSMSVSSK